MRESFPRLLIVTEFPPNATGGGSAIIRQMLRDWPNKKLDWWSCLGESSNRPSWPVRQHAVASIPYKLYPHRKAAQVKGWLLARYWSRWAAKHLMATIEKFEPDVIWAIPHLWSILPLATVLPSLKIPYHISIHDLPDAHHL